ncbi:MAG: endonuclease/exonuclease/phosphatase family protein [Sedimentisphaerales bacterium]|nr:endonuclease/exonuclease/phosphatase family protein [Sedimentisphaerales bacterium]
MLNFVETLVRKSRRWISRSEWLVSLLGLERSRDTAAEPGLVLIQIDGLSRHQLERAVAQGNLPFLRHLLQKNRYHLHSLYSGMPSSTPAMTAELLYGVKGAVPAFSFYDPKTRDVFRMFDPHAAKEIERHLLEKGTPLLTGGSAYTAIYTGGAQESHFCAASTELGELFKKGRPGRVALLTILHLYSVLRIGVLLAVEFVLAVIDFIRGLIAGQDLWKELKFVPSRVGICILMRELATIGAKVDTARGLPIIYVDFIGYDEQSHRRGPTSRFAHWSLKGIDGAIKRIWKAAHRSPSREYDVWVFSDHGNEETLSYASEHGHTVSEAVARVLDRTVSVAQDHRGVQSKRMSSYMPRRQRDARDHQLTANLDEPSEPIIAAMGPIGHVYLNQPVDGEERRQIARALVEHADISTVLVAEGAATVRVWTREGEFTLPEQAGEVLAPNHPFFTEVTQDLIELCHHPNAGDFVISGWNRAGRCYTFPVETGAHGGPGLEETHAFALLPQDAPLPETTATHLRPLALRQAALNHLGRARRPSVPAPTLRRDARLTELRVMTYNVHSCVGIDGKLSPRRIARVIARYEPDIVALQEVDVGRLRTGSVDQAQIVARHLEMEYHFHPTIRIEEEAYGDCILSRLPMHLVKADVLPTLTRTGWGCGYVRSFGERLRQMTTLHARRNRDEPRNHNRNRSSLEPRGALWVTLDVGGASVHLINTHLGLRTRERLLQIGALLGPDWMGANGHPEPFIFCGDFNASPRSRLWRRCARKFRDVQVEATLHTPRGTWFGHYPIARIDHVFISPQIEVVRVDVGDDHLARVASDHRPLFAELRIPRP